MCVFVWFESKPSSEEARAYRPRIEPLVTHVSITGPGTIQVCWQAVVLMSWSDWLVVLVQPGVASSLGGVAGRGGVGPVGRPRLPGPSALLAAGCLSMSQGANQGSAAQILGGARFHDGLTLRPPSHSVLRLRPQAPMLSRLACSRVNSVGWFFSAQRARVRGPFLGRSGDPSKLTRMWRPRRWWGT